MTSQNQHRVHLFVHGRVQGVFFRKYTRDTARKLGIKGWVRNLPDGRVEIIAEGTKEALEQLIYWAKNEGSPLSRVTHVDVQWEPPKNEFDDFSIRY